MSDLVPQIGNLEQGQGYILQPLLTGQLSKNTLRAYKDDLTQFFKLSDLNTLTKSMIEKVTIQNVIDYRNRLLEQYKPASVARKLSTIRTAFTYFVDAGLIDHNPAKNTWVKSPKVPTESLTEGLTQKEAEDLLKQPNQKMIVGLRDYAILQLGLNNGLRRNELVQSKIENLKTEDSFYVLQIYGKGGKLRIAKLKPQVWNAINGYLEARGSTRDPNEHLFVSHSRGRVKWQKRNVLTGEAIRQMVQKYAKQAGIEKHISPHSLRCTFCSLAIEGGCRLDKVQASLGHSDPKTTMRYFRRKDLLADNATDYVHLQA